MKIVTDYKMIGADVLALVRLIYFHNFLTVYLLSPITAIQRLLFSLFWIQIGFLSDRTKESA